MFSQKDNQKYVSPKTTPIKTTYKSQKKEKVELENSIQIQ